MRTGSVVAGSSRAHETRSSWRRSSRSAMPASGKWASKCSGASSFGAWTWLCECQVASTASPTSSLWSLRRTRRGWPIPWAKPWTRARLVLFRAGGRSGKGCATVRCRGHPAGVPAPAVNTRSLGSEERHVGHGPCPPGCKGA